MKAITTLCFILSLIACEYNHMPSLNDKPVREIHTLVETGARLGTMTYTYDGIGNVLRAYFDVNPELARGYEINYEYDIDGNLLKKIHREIPTDDTYETLANITEYTYKDGLKIKEQSYQENHQGGYTSFYYTGHRLDSTRDFGFDTYNSKYIYHNTRVYTYDNAGRLVRDGWKNATGGFTSYAYDNTGRLISECIEYPDEPQSNSCTEINEYDSNGNKVKVKSFDSWRKDLLLEELFYNNGRLSEKKMWEYPMYGNPDLPLVIRIEYQYYDNIGI